MRKRGSRSSTSESSSTTEIGTPPVENKTIDASKKLDVDQMLKRLFLSEGPMAPDSEESIRMQRELGGE